MDGTLSAYWAYGHMDSFQQNTKKQDTIVSPLHISQYSALGLFGEKMWPNLNLSPKHNGRKLIAQKKSHSMSLLKIHPGLIGLNLLLWQP